MSPVLPESKAIFAASAARSSARSLRVDCITNPADFPAIAGEWDRLHIRSGIACFFHDSRVLSAWFHHYPERGKLRLFTLRDASGRLLAAAPLAIMPGRHGYRRFMRHLTFVGCLTDLCPERQDILVDPDAPHGARELLLRTAITHCRGEWDILHLPFLDCSARISGGPAVQEFGHQFQMRNAHFSAHVPLPATWEAYLASLSSSFRKNLLKGMRNLEAAGRVELLEAGRDIGVAEALRELVRLHHLRFGSESTTFSSPRNLKLHEQIATSLAATGDLGLLLLRLDGRCIAAGHDFLHQGTVWSYQSGWDPEFASFSIGHVMTAYSIRWAIGRGQHTYDFLAGEVDYKESWKIVRTTLADYEASSYNTLRGLAYAAGRKLVLGTRAAGTATCATVVEAAPVLESMAGFA